MTTEADVFAEAERAGTVLSQEYADWLATKPHLPSMCAFELLHEEVSREEFNWLLAFNARWEELAQPMIECGKWRCGAVVED